MRGLKTRRLHYAVAASLLFHLLLLWPSPARPPNREASALLQATMRPLPVLPAAPPAPPSVLARAPSAPPMVPLPAPIALPPARAAKVFDPPRPAPVPRAAAISVDPVALPAPGPLAPAPAMAKPAPTIGTPGGALLTQANAAGEVLDGLRGYRLSVASQARGFRRYPPQAMAAGWTGSTEVRLEVGIDGQPRPAIVLRTSGHELLDRAALAMIDAGAQRARLPESLRGRSFVVVLPVVFDLDGE